MEDIERMLDEELKRQLEALKQKDPGSAESKRIIDDFVRLHTKALDAMRLANDEKKAENDLLLARESKEMEREMKKEELLLSRESKEMERETKKEERDEARKNGIRQFVVSAVGVAVTGVTTFVGMALTNRQFNNLLHFEETGSVSSVSGKMFLGKIFRK